MIYWFRWLAAALVLLLCGAAPLVYDIKDISVVSLDTSAGAQNYSLPYAPGLNQAILVKDWNGHASANPITVTAANGGLIDGAASFVMNANYENVIFVNNGPNWSISGASVGPAGGDLSGTFPTPTVAKINGNPLGSTTPSAGNLLIGSGSLWQTEPMSGDATITSLGVLTLNASRGPAGGDLSGTFPNPTVAKINGATLGTTTATPANILIADNTNKWQSVAMSGGATITTAGVVTLNGSLPPNGAAGGDLSGSYPNPTVAKINGAGLGTTTATAAHILVADGANWQSVAMSGNATISTSGVVTVTRGANAEATAANSGSTSGTGTMLGLAGSITPATSGTVEFIIAGSAHHSNAGGTLNHQIRYGTGAAPTNGAALTGTAVGSKLGMQSPNASNKEQIANVARVTGLTVGTAYWYDISLDNGGAGTATVDNITGDAYEQ